jgi:hypothetical protein
MVPMTSPSNRLPIKTPRLGAKRLEKDETLFCLLCIEILLRVSFASSDSFLLLATKRSSRTKKLRKWREEIIFFFYGWTKSEMEDEGERDETTTRNSKAHNFLLEVNQYLYMHVCMYICIQISEIRFTGLFLNDVDAVSRPSACIAIVCCVFCCYPSLTFSLIHLFIILLFLFCFFRHPRIE